MAYMDIARFIREYEEKLERELLALSRKTMIQSVRTATLSIAIIKAVAVEVMRAIVRALDRYESISLYAQQLSSKIEKEYGREEVERAITKLAELISYQKELPKLIDTLRNSIEVELLKDLLEVLKKAEEQAYETLNHMLESLKKELESRAS